MKIVLILCLILFFGIAVGYVYRFSTLWKTKGVPTINTFPKHYKLLKQIHIPAKSSLIDLGCGTGAALRFFAKHFSDLTLYGVDLNKLALKRGRRKNKRSGYEHISLSYQNIYTVDIRSYDYIYLFLMPNVMKDIEQYIHKHIQKDTIVIVNAFAFPTRKPYKTYTDEQGRKKLFLYKKA